ncbi:hypothetical protein EYF80_032160 [Liparis tanakae]|uniref:Uncharacterized protein n=1 Tax=Liparis tanakae TaxID=230148 RepID=A0A4Z2GWJ9_9TELE|nr:hypothetical protein EYF80_032160 [Liparis tanakae]
MLAVWEGPGGRPVGGGLALDSEHVDDGQQVAAVAGPVAGRHLQLGHHLRNAVPHEAALRLGQYAMPSSSRLQRRRISPVGGAQTDHNITDSVSEATPEAPGGRGGGRSPMALGGQRTAAVSPKGVIFHTTLEKLSSAHIS